MIIATTTWPGSSVVQPAIERPTAMRLAETEYRRVTDAVDALRPEDWTRSTDCTAWDVRQLVAHIAGQANLFSTPFELARQLRGAKARERPGQEGVDALTAFQVEERQHRGPDELRIEEGLSPDTIRLLEQMGHNVVVSDAMGSTQSIMVTEAGLFGSSDPRTPGALTLGY